MLTASVKAAFNQYAAVVLSLRIEHARMMARSVMAGRVLIRSTPSFSISIFVSSYLGGSRGQVSILLGRRDEQVDSYICRVSSIVTDPD